MSNLSTHRDHNGPNPHLPVRRESLTEPSEPVDEVSELEILRTENAELRAKVEEMDLAWAERQREYESLLEEKSEVIRSLHLKLQDLQENSVRKTEAPAAVDAQAAEELLQLEKELEEQRHQLQEDEQALMKQMREMELAMSRERAELARQRNELQRIQTEINRELEMSPRDSNLRERLLSLQRRQGESSTGRTSFPVSQSPAPSDPTPVPKKNSGILRRLFGSSQ